MKPSDIKGLYTGLTPPKSLNTSTLDKIKELRSPNPRRGAFSIPLLPAFALVACLLIVALCIASKPNEKGSNSDRTNTFNLEIAEANDDTGSANVAASQSGLMPLQDSIGPSLKLLLNLDVTGANVSSVAYRMVNGASTSRRVTGEQRGEEQPVQTYDTVRLLASGTTDASDADDVWDDSFTVTYKEGSGVGSYQTADGLYPFLFVDSASEDYWNSDPTLALLHEWVVAGTGFDEFDIDPAHTTSDETQGAEESDEVYRARRQQDLSQTIAVADKAERNYRDAFGQQASNNGTFLSWMKSLYVKSYEAANKRLSSARLEAKVTFADGSTQTCLYKISLVDNYQDALANRFDALVNIDNDFSQQLSSKLPWKTWEAPTSEQVDADARLSAAIFKIEEADD